MPPGPTGRPASFGKLTTFMPGVQTCSHTPWYRLLCDGMMTTGYMNVVWLYQPLVRRTALGVCRARNAFQCYSTCNSAIQSYQQFLSCITHAHKSDLCTIHDRSAQCDIDMKSPMRHGTQPSHVILFVLSGAATPQNDPKWHNDLPQ